jgi:hypothetical protein
VSATVKWLRSRGVTIIAGMALLMSPSAGASAQAETVFNCTGRENTSDHRIKVTASGSYRIPARNGSGTIGFVPGVVHTLPYPGSGQVWANPINGNLTVPAQGGGTWTWDLPAVGIDCLNIYSGASLVTWWAQANTSHQGDAFYTGVEECQESSPSPVEEEVLGGPSATETFVRAFGCMDPVDDGSGSSGGGGDEYASGTTWGLYCDLDVFYNEYGHVVAVVVDWESCVWRAE